MAMFLLQSLIPAEHVLDPRPFLRLARDASVDEPARVCALRRLHGAPPETRADISLSLVPLLNEPLCWLTSEALSFIALTSRPLVGVRDGLFVASKTPLRSLIADASGALHCPDLGLVVLARHILQLADRVCLPWLHLSYEPQAHNGYL